MRADAMQAEFLRAGGRIRWDVSSDEVCTITLTHPEFAPDGVQVTEEFKKYEAGGVTKGKDTWKIYRRRMLQCRAISAGIRQVMPQIVAGIYTPEEMADELEREQPATVIPPQAKTESEPQRQALPPAAANQASTNDLTLYRNKAIGEYKLIGVNRDRLEEKHGKADGWGKEKLRELRRIADALKAGETTIDAEFPVGPGQASPEEIARVSAALAPYGVIQQDMEFFVKLPASNWTRDKISQLDWAAQEIVSAQDPMYRAKELFELDPGAQG